MFQCWHVAKDIPLASQAQAVSTHHSPAIKYSALIGSWLNTDLWLVKIYTAIESMIIGWYLGAYPKNLSPEHLHHRSWLHKVLLEKVCLPDTWQHKLYILLVSIVDSLLINTCVFQSRASCQHMFQTSDLSLHTHKHRVLPRKSLQHTRNCRSFSQYSQSQEDTRPSL